MSYLKPEIFTIDCLTNMLVGSGKANYGVIDQLVQRDVTSHAPIIHASSLKGAIKEFCSHKEMDDAKMKCIFGSAKKSTNGATPDTQVGEFKFLDAHLLALPVRSDKTAFVHITSGAALEILVNFLEIYKLGDTLQSEIKAFANLIVENEGNEAIAFSSTLHETAIEETDILAKYDEAYLPKYTVAIRKLLPENTVLVSNKLFKALSNDLHLPVIARNHLENGESTNLWYEQVIPRQSKFWFSLLYPEIKKDEYTSLITILAQPPIQIGANASVGYGYTTIKPTIK